MGVAGGGLGRAEAVVGGGRFDLGEAFLAQQLAVTASEAQIASGCVSHLLGQVPEALEQWVGGMIDIAVLIRIAQADDSAGAQLRASIP